MSKVGNRYYGKTEVTLQGVRAWEGQDATQTWSDGGEVKSILDDLNARIEEVVARNATLAVSEYAADGQAALRVGDKSELLIGVRLHNHEASLIIDVPLKTLLIAALTEMRDKVAIDPDAQAALSGLVDLGRQLGALAGTSANGSGVQVARQDAELSPQTQKPALKPRGRPKKRNTTATMAN